jgi:hypothetical protein
MYMHSDPGLGFFYRSPSPVDVSSTAYFDLWISPCSSKCSILFIQYGGYTVSERVCTESLDISGPRGCVQKIVTT